MLNDDHDLLLRNTVITEQVAKQLNDALGQLARGNERFSQHENRITHLEQALPNQIAQTRTDLLRAVVQSSELKKDSIEAALAPIRTNIDKINKFMESINTTARRIGKVVVWTGRIITAGITAVVVGYLLWYFGLR